MKRGQAANQVFIYLLAAIIFAGVLLYGYNAIDTLQEKARYVTILELKSDVESSLEEIATTQNRELESFKIPRGYKKVCFFDRSKDYDDYKQWKSDCGIGNFEGLICDAWKYNSSKNGLLVPMGDIAFDTVPLTINTGSDTVPVHCFNVTKGKLKLRVQGKGNGAEIIQVFG